MLGVLQNILLTFAPIIVILGVVVTIHELGHFLAAKALGAKVDQFSIGFGKALASWTDRSGVQWRLGWVPLGGYVRFAGDDNAASVPDQDDLETLRRDLVARDGEAALAGYFHFMPLWRRAVITVAGPVANFILSIAVFSILLMTLGERVSPARVDIIVPGSPAAHAGFQLGDVIVRANRQKIDGFQSLKEVVALSSGTPIDFIVQRQGVAVALTATPERAAQVDQLGHVQHLGQLGVRSDVKPGDLTLRRYTPLAAIAGGVDRTWGVVHTTVRYIGRMLTGRETAEQLSGPLGMAQLSGEIAKQTAAASPTLGIFLLNALITTFELIANISVGIGFLNLMPIPVLDGGHLLFYSYEAVTRRPLAAKVQAAGYRVGLALVLGLMLFATWNDLQRLRVFNFIGGLFS